MGIRTAEGDTGNPYARMRHRMEKGTALVLLCGVSFALLGAYGAAQVGNGDEEDPCKCEVQLTYRSDTELPPDIFRTMYTLKAFEHGICETEDSGGSTTGGDPPNGEEDCGPKQDCSATLVFKLVTLDDVLGMDHWVTDSDGESYEYGEPEDWGSGKFLWTTDDVLWTKPCGEESKFEWGPIDADPPAPYSSLTVTCDQCDALKPSTGGGG